MVFGFQPFRARCNYALGQALCAPYSVLGYGSSAPLANLNFSYPVSEYTTISTTLSLILILTTVYSRLSMRELSGLRIIRVDCQLLVTNDDGGK
jgi:hypothetical protein